MVYFIGKTLIRIFGKVLFDVKVTGRENLPKKGGFIVAANHVSYLDPPIIGAACPGRLFYMARHDLFRNPLFGVILRSVNVFPVKRNSADITALKKALKILKSGRGLLLFPEGSRQQPGRLGEPTAGVGLLVAKSKAPVIPAFIKGTEIALPKGAKKLTRAKVTIHFGKPVNFERGIAYKDIAAGIMKSISDISCALNS